MVIFHSFLLVYQRVTHVVEFVDHLGEMATLIVFPEKKKIVEPKVSGSVRTVCWKIRVRRLCRLGPGGWRFDPLKMLHLNQQFFQMIQYHPEKQGLVNVPIEHHPSIGDIISNRYLKAMFKIPKKTKKGHLPTPEKWRFFSLYQGFKLVASMEVNYSDLTATSP